MGETGLGPYTSLPITTTTTARSSFSVSPMPLTSSGTICIFSNSTHALAYTASNPARRVALVKVELRVSHHHHTHLTMSTGPEPMNLV